MGLDISVYKVMPIGNRVPETVEHFFTLRESSELNVFKHLSFKKKNQYYNMKKAIKDLGYKSKDLECTGYSFGQDMDCNFLNKKHLLYKAYAYLNTIWSKTYFNTFEELEKSEYYKTFVSKFLDTLKNEGWKENYYYFASGSNTYYHNLRDAFDFCHDKILVRISTPPLLTKNETCIAIEEVGYQRKGANKQFYEDNMWSGQCVIDKKTLIDHWKKYFSHATPESKGGFGSGVEYKQIDEEMKRNFKENIIDKFIEGETFVCYH